MFIPGVALEKETFVAYQLIFICDIWDIFSLSKIRNKDTLIYRSCRQLWTIQNLTCWFQRYISGLAPYHLVSDMHLQNFSWTSLKTKPLKHNLFFYKWTNVVMGKIKTVLSHIYIHLFVRLNTKLKRIEIFVIG